MINRNKIKLIYICFYYLIFLLILSGCFAVHTSNISDSSAFSKDTSCTPITYEKVSSSKPERPSWIMTEPGDEAGMHYIIGISGYHKTERDAREDAMRHSREEFARYTGVEVSQLNEISRDIYGKSSEILDSTISGKNQSTQETNALVSRIKAKEWYFEKLNGKCQKKDQGIAYQYWVLAVVPVEEYDKVQEWKAKRGALKDAKKTKEKLNIKKEVDRLTTLHKQDMVKVKELMERGYLITSLTILQSDWNRLYHAGKSIEGKGDSFSSEVEYIKSMQREIPVAIQQIRSQLVIDTGRGGIVWIPSNYKEMIEIPVWLWYRQDNQIIPVSGIPLIFKDNKGNRLISRGKTGPEGKTAFYLKETKTMSYKVFIDPEEGLLVSLAQPVKEAMESVSSNISVRVYTPDMGGAARAGVQGLFKGPSLKPLSVKKVVMGTVSYEESRLGSEFGKRLETLIEREISNVSGIVLIRRKQTRSIDSVITASRTRGIGRKDKPVQAMSSPAMQAEIDGAEAILETSYFIQGEKVNIDFRLIQAGTGRVIANSGAGIDKNLIPDDMQLIPYSTEASIDPINTGLPGEIRLELTTQRGDGATFAEGEKIQYFVSTDKDAYLLLLYKDAEGNLIQIYPNDLSGNGFHHAEEYMEIPKANSSYDFTITPPFGVEEVWAFAATTPFPILKTKGKLNELKMLGNNMQEIADKMRDHGRKSGVSYGETNVVVTTVKE